MGKMSCHPPYGIDNGVIQGNGPSPQEFLVGMHMMMLEIGMCPHPLQIGGALVGPTGYADDLSNIHTGVQGGSRVVQRELLNQRDCHSVISGETILW